MRRMVRIRHRRLFAIALGAVVSLAGAAGAQPDPYGRPAPTEAGSPAAPAVDPFAPAVPTSTGQPLPPPEPGSVMRRPEHLSHRPSGFWTSNRPAKGGAYRWEHMACGAVVLAIAVFFLVRMLRRVSCERRLAVAGDAAWPQHRR